MDLQCRGMRENIIIHGIPEERAETYRITEKLLKGFMKEQLKMNKAEVEAVDFARAHRIGQKQIDQQWPRPVVARFNDFKKKLALMEKTDTSKDPASSLMINSLRR